MGVIRAEPARVSDWAARSVGAAWRAFDVQLVVYAALLVAILWRQFAHIAHEGAAFIDVISPCVAFNNHAGSTKSYDYIREHNEAVNRLDFWPSREAITVDYSEGGVIEVPQHDGSVIKLRKLDPDYDASDRVNAMTHIARAAEKGEVLTGLLYLAPDAEDLHGHLNTYEAPFNKLAEKDLCPGGAMLEKINAGLR